jgi:hypothetical protein
MFQSPLRSIPVNLDHHFKRAVEINQAALTRIVAGIVALLAAHGAITRLPLPVYREIALALHKSESAVRRLIVIAARSLSVPLPSPRPFPPGLVIQSNGLTATRRLAFPLVDPRQHYDWTEADPAAGGPRIRIVGDPGPRAQFLRLFAKPADDRASETATQNLRRRVEAVNRALENLTREAKRLARWRARHATVRAVVTTPKILTPLRPGPPPGNNKTSKTEIDTVLRECHALAWDALRKDSS